MTPLGLFFEHVFETVAERADFGLFLLSQPQLSSDLIALRTLLRLLGLYTLVIVICAHEQLLVAKGFDKVVG